MGSSFASTREAEPTALSTGVSASPIRLDGRRNPLNVHSAREVGFEAIRLLDQ